MTLEEKVSALPSHLREQVEDYIDFLLSRMDESEDAPDLPFMAESVQVRTPKSLDSSPAEESLQSDPVSSRGTKNSSGIILAEEKVPESNPDYVDFADINSRFGHTPKTEDEQRGPGRLRRLLDWM